MSDADTDDDWRDDDWGDLDPLAEAIGRVIQANARFDLTLSQLLVALTSRGPELGVQLLVQGQGTSWLLDHTNKSAAVADLTPALTDYISMVTAAGRDALIQRNQMAHAIWIIEHDNTFTTHRPRAHKTPTSQPFTVDNVQHVSRVFLELLLCATTAYEHVAEQRWNLPRLDDYGLAPVPDRPWKP